MTYRLSVVRVFALDWQAAVDFYEHTLELPLRYRDAEAGWAEYDLGGPGLAVERVRPDRSEAPTCQS